MNEDNFPEKIKALTDTLEIIKKHIEIICKDYMEYLTYDERLESTSKAIRKKTVQSLKRLLNFI